MSNIWPAIAGTEQEVEAEARADLAAYTACLMHGDEQGCIRIEAKYGLFDHSPQRVCEELADIAASQELQL